MNLELTFTAPLLMNDLELLSRPINYISYQATSTDGKVHDVEIYFEASPDWELNQPHQQSRSESREKAGLVFLKTRSTAQNILSRAGDDVRIDWGHFYMDCEKEDTEYTIGDSKGLRSDFINNTITKKKRGGENDSECLALIRKPGKTKKASGKIMVDRLK